MCIRDRYLSDLYGSNYVIEQFMINNRYEEEKRMGRVIEDWDMSRLRVGEDVYKRQMYNSIQYFVEKVIPKIEKREKNSWRIQLSSETLWWSLKRY